MSITATAELERAIERAAGVGAIQENTASLSDGESFVTNTDGNVMMLVQVRDVVEAGDLILETGEEGDWWPNEELSFDDDGFEQIPWNPAENVRITSEGFSGEVRLVAG